MLGMAPDQWRRTGLSSLAAELILRIIDFLEPESHLDFACTSKFFMHCSRPTLERHRAAYEKYRVASDLQPSTAPALLRSSLGYSSPIDAWHVRSFEVWGTRTSWDEWRPFDLHEKDPPTVQRGKPFAWRFQDGEDGQLVDLFSDRMSEEEQRMASKELQAGRDGFLKMALLCLLPRLVDIKFTKGVDEEISCLAWLVRAISRCRRSALWPSSLANLGNIAVGVSSGTWRDGSRDDRSPYTLAAMLQLPRLRSLYFDGLHWDEDLLEEFDETDSDVVGRRCSLLPASSSVERLFLDNTQQLAHGFRQALLAAPRALEALSVRVNPDQEFGDVDLLVSELGRSQGDSLRRLMFYGPGELEGYRCNAYLPGDLRDYRDLRQVSIKLGDVEHCAVQNLMDERLEDFVDLFVDTFPHTLEVLVFLGGSGRWLERLDHEYLDAAVVKMVDSGLYPNMKAIFFPDIDTPEVGSTTGHISLQEAMVAGSRNNVDIFKYTQTQKRGVDRIEFHAPSGKYDLASGPHWYKDRVGWIVNPYNGEWDSQ